jgi:hypothetical protein
MELIEFDPPGSSLLSIKQAARKYQTYPGSRYALPTGGDVSRKSDSAKGAMHLTSVPAGIDEEATPRI